ncbi:MAG: rRNA (adenine1518-N6/adenine1519-N6)-dimethyltransferase [Deferribacteres bacterium]|jgi:16S rRNA (adenine1518-N6/adenine1519-N6)-dimethyltransferase|nr:dimethyladenosine transferase [Deferribacteraceae bacterium]MDK2791669.1 rRNA (adenine1518-N6/adenine1519-N6)-dimethyltransferase [Deferribacteres bacterium]
MLNLIQIFKGEFGHTKKSFGQHFLTNKHILKLICDEADIKEGDFVVEIGPGCGVLTYEILERNANLISVEIDKELAHFLKRYLHIYPNFQIINKDFLLTDYGDFGKNCLIKFVGNLPYNVSTKIVEHTVKFHNNIEIMVFMFQKEVADRIISRPKAKTYSSLSIFCQYFFNISKVKNLSGKNFWPSTKVESTVLKFVPKNRYFEDEKVEKDFLDFVKRCFVSKRKTIKNNLKSIDGIEKKINSFFGSDNVRGEELSVEDFIKFYEYIRS